MRKSARWLWPISVQEISGVIVARCWLERFLNKGNELSASSFRWSRSLITSFLLIHLIFEILFAHVSTHKSIGILFSINTYAANSSLQAWLHHNKFLSKFLILSKLLNAVKHRKWLGC